MLQDITLENQRYILTNEVRTNSKLRNSFNQLAQKTFGLSFEPWYQNGYWQEKYIPYVITRGDEVIANASVNIMDMSVDSIPKRFIQIGTVMTAEDYRNQGLSKMLMKIILEERQSKCDGFYLFANDRVLDFYPKFGFIKANEYQYTIKAMNQNSKIRQLDMNKKDDIELLLKNYHLGNPFSRFTMADNPGLLMFYCSQFMRENVYFCERNNLVFIAEYSNRTMICYDIFGNSDKDIDVVLPSLAQKEIETITLGFTPKQTYSIVPNRVNVDNTTLFVSQEIVELLGNGKLMFPLLSHA